MRLNTVQLLGVRITKHLRDADLKQMLFAWLDCRYGQFMEILLQEKSSWISEYAVLKKNLGVGCFVSSSRVRCEIKTEARGQFQ